MPVDEFADLLWRCLVQERPLRTVVASRSEIEWTQKKLREHEAAKKKAASEKDEQKRMHKEVSSKNDSGWHRLQQSYS